MTLQAKLTLGTVLLATVLVALISAVYLANTMQTEFEHTLKRAEMVQAVAIDYVKAALNRPHAPPPAEALSSPELFDRLRTIMTASKEILEVAVVGDDGEILADSFADRRGERSQRYESLRPLVTRAGWIAKLRVLRSPDSGPYQIEQEMGPPTLFVRVIVAPALISDYIRKPLNDSAHIALIAVIGATCITFLFSAFLFRPLGRLRRQLDLLASGNYDQPQSDSRKPAGDEISIMASKVNILGERLRGAQGEVTDLRGNMDRLIHKIGRQLQTADRLSAISRISGGVAHEVKNPLNAILLHVEVARTRIARGDTDVTPQMDVIAREILRLDRVVRTFLDFTRPVELKLVQVSLPDLLGEIIELARPQADAGNIRVVAPDIVSAQVRVDRDLFKQAVLNIVVNAIQAMPQGGELRFETSADSDTAEIRISDTGAGIPPELKEKIFRLYFTTKQGGSGIGLAMTFRIVQLHDGTIDFSSEPGKGATFVIRLPLAF